MRSLLFLGYEFHRKTGSSDFITDLFLKSYDVTCCYIDLLAEDPYSKLEVLKGRKFDVLVCWQVMPPRQLLNRLFGFDIAVLFPMIDGCPSVKKIEKWYPYRDFNIICFAKILSDQLKRAGFCARYIQYFPQPLDQIEDYGDDKSAFFWFRREEISPPLVETLFSQINLTSLHIHNVPDPGQRFIPVLDPAAFEVSYSSWYDRKEDMLADVKARAYYITPRLKEGIGMSFLEAMAMGRCVVAPDSPTMNEYIQHGKTGLLYDLKKAIPLEPVDVRAIQKNTVEYMKQGRLRWERDIYCILDWICSEVKVSKFKISRYYFWRFLKNPLKASRVLISEIF